MLAQCPVLFHDAALNLAIDNQGRHVVVAARCVAAYVMREILASFYVAVLADFVRLGVINDVLGAVGVFVRHVGYLAAILGDVVPNVPGNVGAVFVELVIVHLLSLQISVVLWVASPSHSMRDAVRGWQGWPCRPVALLAETFREKVGGRCRDNRIDSAVECGGPVPVVFREAKACQAKDRCQHVRGCDSQVIVDGFHCLALHWRCDNKIIGAMVALSQVGNEKKVYSSDSIG